MKHGYAQRAALAGLVLALCHAPATLARVVSLDIQSTTAAFGGQSFGSTGAYQLLQGTVRYEVDPRLPLNASLVNIGHAPRNADRKSTRLNSSHSVTSRMPSSA